MITDMDDSPQRKKPPSTARGAGFFSYRAMPALVAAGVGGVMVWVAGAVRLPSAEGGGVDMPGANAPGGAPLPTLNVTRLDTLPLGGEARERLRLLDPTPLIMPGGRFGGAQFTPDGPDDRPGGEAGSLIAPALVFPDQRPTRDILRPRPPGDAESAAVMVAESRWFAGMARIGEPDRGGPAVPATLAGAGRLDVFAAGEAVPVASAVLPADELLASETWRPFELSLVMGIAGPVTPPVVRTGSGVGEVDEWVRSLLAREVLPRLTLRPGPYRLVVGP